MWEKKKTQTIVIEKEKKKVRLLKHFRYILFEIGMKTSKNLGKSRNKCFYGKKDSHLLTKVKLLEAVVEEWVKRKGVWCTGIFQKSNV